MSSSVMMVLVICTSHDSQPVLNWGGAATSNPKPPTCSFGPARESLGHSTEVPNWGQSAAKVESEAQNKGLPDSFSSGILCPLKCLQLAVPLFHSQKVLPRRKSSGPAHIPAALWPPEVLFTAHNMALWLDINWKCISCPSVITLVYGSFIQHEALLFFRMKFCIIFLSSNVQMKNHILVRVGKKGSVITWERGVIFPRN